MAGECRWRTAMTGERRAWVAMADVAMADERWRAGGNVGRSATRLRWRW
jgi:hypothetical protein